MSAPIALALDGPDRGTVLAWASAAAPHVAVMKVGLETFLRDGATIVDDVRGAAPGQQRAEDRDGGPHRSR